MANASSISTCFVDPQAVPGLCALLEESIAFGSAHEPDRRGGWAGERADGGAIDVDYPDGIVTVGWVGISPCCIWFPDNFHVGAKRTAISVMRYWLDVLDTARIALVDEQERAWDPSFPSRSRPTLRGQPILAFSAGLRLRRSHRTSVRLKLLNSR